MSKEFITRPISADCEEDVVRPVSERELTMDGKTRDNSLKIVVCSFVFCLLSVTLGFALSELSYTARHQINEVHVSATACRPIDDFHQLVYFYDTEQKLEDYNKTMQNILTSKNDIARKEFALMGRDRPLVEAGPFIIVVNNVTGEFSVCDAQTHSYLVEMRGVGQTKTMRLNGLLEKGQRFSRFFAALRYSEDGAYEGGNMSLRDDNGVSTYYRDNKGIGVFDTITKEIIEDGVRAHYRLNDLTWERIDDPPPMLPPPP
jgi:hypothetical protein